METVKVMTVVLALVLAGCSSSSQTNNADNLKRTGYEMLQKQQFELCLQRGEEDCHERFGESYEDYKERREEHIEQAKQE